MDVAGHELTRAVVRNTAAPDVSVDPGAMNEALADYLGNAVEVTTRGIPTTDPRACGEDVTGQVAPVTRSAWPVRSVRRS
ncbi:hypothetical protein [Kitasatospora purpeofusca]|uniref:hypothetical protein n=1 Tax=Kitasatospora purpeofusca TaxID=67352 RepID=UPI002A5AC05F|nr:hypothetical protein [Kitasatospora purpeofusca]MDY0816841.1 hypothetical protein [Kitasatospora purpeofusca]